MRNLLLFLHLAALLAACGPLDLPPVTGMGGNGMMARHHADIPPGYSGRTNPVPADEDSLVRGSELYAVNCASCHGDAGMGDGPAGAGLDPAPAAIAHTSQMMADDYLFWRVSEGGVPFGTSMPSWKVLDEGSRWDLVNYMRALGAGTVSPAGGVGGAAFGLTAQAVQQADMLAKAVEQGLLTQAEADLFNTVHGAVEQYRTAHPDLADRAGSATEREAALLAALVRDGTITPEQADAFQDIHDRLGASGLAP